MKSLKGKEPNSEERQLLIMEIMSLAFAVHESTEYCVFIDFSGHVNSLEISIRESVERYQNKVCDTEVYSVYKEYYDIGEADAHLKAVRDILKKILKDGEVPYGEMERQIEEVVTYIF